MANIKKSLNLRHGLVVDDDNFIVNANGLVGIGSTLPTEILDVGGNIRVRGTIISESNQFENATITDSISVDSLTASVKIVSGITSISSGIITGYGGILKYYGDGSNLDGLPTSQWKNVDVGLGYTSIYNDGAVGVATNDPRFTFQVGGTNNLSNFTNGVGINSTGSIFATGIVTAGSFSGTLSASDMTTGSIQDGIFDNVTVNINTSGIITATSFSGTTDGSDITTGTIPSNVFGDVNTTGIITAASFSGTLAGSDIQGTIPSNVFENINTTGIITATSFSGILTATDIEGILPSNVFQDINISSGVVTATKFVGLGSNLTSLNPSEIQNISGSQYLPSDVFNNIIAEGDLTVKGAFDGSISTARGLSGTPSIDVNNINSSGIGSFADVEVRSTVATVRVVGSTDAIVSIGKSDYGEVENIGQIEYSDQRLKIYNYDLGGIDFSIHQGPFTGINTENYNWFHGKYPSTPLMTLTYEGKLGLGKTNADDTLHVVGTSTVTSNSFVGGDLKVYGDVNVDGNITGSFDSSVTLNNSINTETGIGTFNQIIASGTSPKIGIGTLVPKTDFEVVGDAIIERIGINTNTIGKALEVYGDVDVTGTLDTKSLNVTGFTTFTSVGINTDTQIGGTKLHVNGDLKVEGDVSSIQSKSTAKTIALGGFISEVGVTTAVQITLENIDDDYDSSQPTRLVFTVVGVGSTSLALY